MHFSSGENSKMIPLDLSALTCSSKLINRSLFIIATLFYDIDNEDCPYGGLYRADDSFFLPQLAQSQLNFVFQDNGNNSAIIMEPWD